MAYKFDADSGKLVEVFKSEEIKDKPTSEELYRRRFQQWLVETGALELLTTQLKGLRETANGQKNINNMKGAAAVKAKPPLNTSATQATTVKQNQKKGGQTGPQQFKMASAQLFNNKK